MEKQLQQNLRATTLFLIGVLSLLQNFSFAQQPSFGWVKGIGSNNNDESNSVAVDAEGNIYTTGYFSGTVDFDPGPGIYNLISPLGAGDVFISKLDASGNFIWAKNMGGQVNDIGKSITVDALGNVYIMGEFYGTADFDPGAGVYNLSATYEYSPFISKLDSLGNFVWAKKFGDNGQTSVTKGECLNLDNNGNVYVTGSFSETVDFDPGIGVYNLTPTGASPFSNSEDIFILKLNSSGNFVWAKNMGGNGFDEGKSLTVDNVGNIYTTGTFVGTADFNPGSGTYNLTSVGNSDAFISKLDSLGNFIWAKRLASNTNHNTSGYSIVVDALHCVYTTGYFNGTTDFDPGVGNYYLSSLGYGDIFISKIDALGNFIWAKKMGGLNGDIGISINLDDLANVYTTGYFAGTVDFDPGNNITNLSAVYVDLFISKLDSSGNFSWAKNFTSDNNEYSNSIVVDAAKNVIVTGFYQGTVDFDPGAGVFNLSSIGNKGIFVLKLNQTAIVNNKPNLGNDTTVKICPGAVRSIAGLYNTTNYTNVMWSAPRPDSVGIGYYTIIVTNSFDLNDTAIVTVDTVSINPRIITANATCSYGLGAIQVIASGGMPPYLYKLDSMVNYQSLNVFKALPLGTYKVNIKDSLVCKIFTTDPVSITSPTPITTSFTQTDATCIGKADGTITVTTSGGKAPYGYKLGLGGVYNDSKNFTGLKAGTYTLYIKDVYGCTGSTSAIIVGQANVTCLSIVAGDNAPIEQKQTGIALVLTPNPCNNLFTLRIFSDSKQVVQLRVLDISGKTLYTAKGQPEQPFRFGGEFVSGVYLVEVMQGDVVRTVKAVKM